MSEKEPKLANLGLLPPEEKPEDYIAGTLSAIPFEVKEKDGDWKQYRRLDEIQKFPRIESMACVSYSGNNSIEAQINRMIVRDDLDLDLLKPWLDETGFFNGSDRALAKMSNTSTSGNSQSRVADTIRHGGIIPQKLWPNKIEGTDFDWTEFYQTIPQDVLDYGQKFLEYFDIQYERLPDLSVSTLKKHLQHAPIWIAIGICDGYWENGQVIQACSASPVHAIVIDNYEDLKKWFEYDSYEPFGKLLAWNYRFYYPYKLVVTPKEIIKKKVINENDMPKLYQETGKPELYVLGKQDAFYHHIEDEPTFKNLFGNFSEVEIVQMTQIPDNQKGDPIAQVSTFAKLINNFLYSLKGKK